MAQVLLGGAWLTVLNDLGLPLLMIDIDGLTPDKTKLGYAGAGPASG